MTFQEKVDKAFENLMSGYIGYFYERGLLPDNEKAAVHAARKDWLRMRKRRQTPIEGRMTKAERAKAIYMRDKDDIGITRKMDVIHYMSKTMLDVVVVFADLTTNVPYSPVSDGFMAQIDEVFELVRERELPDVDKKTKADIKQMRRDYVKGKVQMKRKLLAIELYYKLDFQATLKQSFKKMHNIK